MGNLKKKTNFKETSKMGNSKIMGLSKLGNYYVYIWGRY